ncbi:MAG TPA: exo-beta-N-acetylmuramidase NamZ domain-containing protein [Pyrinomonadaceae bacterium]|nr:exo-beta-N-acetylmuramidase NamZ domain-containing protein [Pyrinomonadaceae bacterium]
MKKLRITNYKLRIIKILCVLCVLCGSIFSQGLPIAAPQTVGMSAERLNQIDALIEKDIADKKLPGAVVIVGRKGKIVYRKAFGNRSLIPTVEKMTVDTIFDVASLTKPIATATSIMILVERGQLRLNDTIGKFIPEIEDENAKRVTIQQLLTHTSGYQPDFDLREKWTGRDGMLQALYKEKLRQPAGTKFVYSDIGFIVLGEIVGRLGEVLECINPNCFDTFAERNIFQLLKMQESEFFRLSNTSVESLVRQIDFIEKRVAPTENIKGQNNYLGSKFEGDEKTGEQILRGQVHDPTAFRMGGVAGHAGLFSTADDLARYCQMLLNGGILDGKRILSAQTVARMTAPYVVSETGATRGLGWDMNSSFSANRGEFFPLGSFGHTGFTGTSVWIDRVSQTFVVFLSNRVHPDGKGDVTPLRAKVSTVVASAIEDVPIEVIRLSENIYSSQVAAQIPNFIKQQSAVSTQQSVKTVTVLNGIDVLEKNNFKELDGLKIGLVTNHTGRNLSGRQTIDVFKEAKNVKLVALFSPEHGIRGQLDQEKIVDSTDEKTGLPIYSLYGETRRPKPEQLKDLDAIVFDIQDIGTRFYTYISTLQNVMEEAAKAGKPIFVLDRPNPINGVDVAGAVADADKLTFVATHTLPVRHGMTTGEIAQMFNAEKKIGADLRVIKMENWQRQMWFDQTNQTWTNPSPNMRSLTQATLYGGIGLLEYTNLSVGRGTDTPFEVVGAPWIDGRQLAAFLNKRNLSGVRFVPIKYKPTASVFKGEEVSGINIIITNREEFEPIRTGIEIAVALRKLYPTEWKMEKYLNLIVNQEGFEKIKRADAPEEIERAWQKDLDEFKKRRAQFLLYK